MGLRDMGRRSDCDVKDYLIWLNSGVCIEGVMNDNEAYRLNQAFKNKSSQSGIIEFVDANGILLVEMNKVDAISINEPVNKNVTGF